MMIGLGTIINIGAVLLGGVFGLLFGKRLKPRFQDSLQKAVGVSVLFLGIGGAMEKMLTISDGKLSSGGAMMIIGSMALGTVIGELLNIEAGIERFGEYLKRKTKSEKDMHFVDGFITTTFTICIGAMAVVGSINDGIFGDYSILAAKSVLDMIIVMIMTSSKGKGCIFSVIPVAILQGGVTLLARYIEPILTETALLNLSLAGSILIFCVGLNLVWGKRVKVANMLPAIIFAVGFAFLPI